MTEWIGQTLGRYHLESVIGEGAMGIVMRARDPELERTVAIKILYPHLATDRELVERFRREARSAANLHHRNIVAIHDVGQERRLYYLVMEYLEGQPLSMMIRERGALPPAEALEIAEQIASALDYLREQDLVHRDVKSSNIIVNPNGRAVLTDFGLARAMSGSTLTASGAIVGTPQYIAPEQLSGGQIGPWTDLYALGVVVYQTLSGHYPFEIDPPSVLFFQVLSEQAPLIGTPLSDLPAAVDAVLGRALAKEPEDRYPTGAAFVAALVGALSERQAPIGKPAAPPPGPGTRPAGRPVVFRWQSVLIVLMVLMAAGAAFLLAPEILPNSLPPATGTPRAATAVIPPTTTGTSGLLVASAAPTVPTRAPSPTSVPTTPVPVPPTTTAPPPTATSTRKATAPARPTMTPTPTNSPQPTVPTSTPRPTVVPTEPPDTPQPTATFTPTDTPEPPTLTPTNTEAPSPTNTPAPPPTNTLAPQPTNTLAPQPTNTPAAGPLGAP